MSITQTFPHRAAQAAVRYRWYLFALGLLITAALYPVSQKLSYNRSISSLFAADDPRLITQQQVSKQFSSEADCLAVYTDPELLTGPGMRRLEALTRRLEEDPSIADAFSLADAPRPSRPVSLTAFQPTRLVDSFTDPQADLAELRQEVLTCELYRDIFVSADGQTAGIRLAIAPDALASGAFSDTLERIRETAKQDPLQPVIVGSPVLISDVYEFIERDAWTLANVSTVAVMLVVAIIFRSLRWLILPMAMVQGTLIWTRAYMVFADIELSLIGSMTTALVTVIAIATVIHVAMRFREERRLVAQSGGTVRDAVERTFVYVGPPVFWACVTTAMGFASLAVSRVAPVQEYAQVMAIASLTVFALAALTLPAGMLLGTPNQPAGSALGEATLGDSLTGLVGIVVRRPWTTFALAAAIMAIAGVGIARLSVETDFTRNFRESNPLLKGYRFVERELGGAGVLDLTFSTPPTLTADFLQQVSACEAKLRQIDGVTKVSGLTDFLEFFRDALPGGGIFGLVQPSASPVYTVGLTLLQTARPDAVASFWNEKAQTMRLVLRVREQQTVQGKTQLLQQLRQTASEALDRPVQVSGLYVLLVYLIDSLLGDQWLAFGVASAVLWLTLILAFRNITLGTIAFVPNIVPIFAVLGLMGWLGLKINVATAMIGSISMGLVVDFSIHYLTRYRQQRAAGDDFLTALAATHRSTGKAMVFANLALTLGFGVLIFSGFIPTMHFGLLVSIATLGGLVGNLVLLPALLRVTEAEASPRSAPASV